jgi:hypothetical protein
MKLLTEATEFVKAIEVLHNFLRLLVSRRLLLYEVLFKIELAKPLVKEVTVSI